MYQPLAILYGNQEVRQTCSYSLSRYFLDPLRPLLRSLSYFRKAIASRISIYIFLSRFSAWILFILMSINHSSGVARFVQILSFEKSDTPFYGFFKQAQSGFVCDRDRQVLIGIFIIIHQLMCHWGNSSGCKVRLPVENVKERALTSLCRPWK